VSHLILRGQLALLLAVTDVLDRVADPAVHPGHRPHARGRGDGGQTTAEYGLVLLGAAGIALLLVGWATKSGAIGKLFDAVMDNVIGRVK
jgi:4-hydroxybenzoate polyprenyltransferase